MAKKSSCTIVAMLGILLCPFNLAAQWKVREAIHENFVTRRNPVFPKDDLHPTRLIDSQGAFLFATNPRLSHSGFRKDLFLKEEEQKNTPPLDPLRITGEIVGGVAGGAAGAGVAGLLFKKADISAIFFVAMAYIGGCTWGVYAIGNIGEETGSLVTTEYCSGLGFFLGLGIIGIRGGSNVSLVPLFAGPPILATIGFNLTRKYKNDSGNEPSLFNFQQGRTTLAVPSVYYRSISIPQNVQTQNVELLRISF
jgi:hypothetical protein